MTLVLLQFAVARTTNGAVVTSTSGRPFVVFLMFRKCVLKCKPGMESTALAHGKSYIRYI